MKAGILQGYGAMADGLVSRFRKRYGRMFRVVATGGLAKTLAPYSTQIDIVDPLLTLKSLARLFQDQTSFGGTPSKSAGFP
jgi:type III pantothenate kinase